ncbi:MAG: molybdopterin molybdotransferase MoeA [Syntrophorhabdaceae bacterium]|nr:molybdopterin molybdotransferase MoeA [Syntrophorhabdaceae bacterium]
MRGKIALGLKEALRLTLEAIEPLPAENVTLVDSVDRVAASDLNALVDSPLVDVSRKDGYAVVYREVEDAAPDSPVRLRLIGSAAAGGVGGINLEPGATVRVLTGARIPVGADAVVAEEFTHREGDDVFVEAGPTEPGRNVLPGGSDVYCGQRVLESGRRISPSMAGFLAAAGHNMIPVVGRPRVGIVGTGDEIVEPGTPLTEGRLYASNIITLAGWCERYALESRMAIVKDDYEAITATFRKMSAETDVMITSGGAWTGDRDMVSGVLEGLGWRKVFHQVRIGPGKAVGFGILNKKPVFILPGGPPSNLIGFLEIALPGLMALSGHKSFDLPRINAALGSEIVDGKADWTDFFFGTLTYGDELPVFYPMKKRSRLGSIAEADAIAAIPEGHDSLPKGSVISVQLLT